MALCRHEKGVRLRPELRKSLGNMSYVGNGSAEDLAAIIALGRECYGKIVAERNILD